jgi:hypothetical protein
LAVVGGVVVFLMGCCLLVLVVIALRLGRLVDILQVSARRLARPDKGRRRAARASLVRELRAVRRAVVGELRQQARERRATLARLVGEERTPLEPIPASAPPTSRPRALVKPGVFSLPPDAPTPPSGYAVSALLSGPEGGGS